MSLRKLGVVKDIVDAAGMGLAYAYDDLVFLTHNAILLQFTDDENTLLLHSNQEAEEDELAEGVNRLKAAATDHAMQFVDGGLYTIEQADPENLRIEFLPAPG